MKNNAPAAVPMKETNNYSQGRSGVKVPRMGQKGHPNPRKGGGINRPTQAVPQK